MLVLEQILFDGSSNNPFFTHAGLLDVTVKSALSSIGILALIPTSDVSDI
jgi:hypothetical protein